MRQIKRDRSPRAKADRQQLISLRQREHPNCIVCGQQHPLGLQLDFSVLSDGCVEATYPPDTKTEGYEGLLHGGIVASLLDGAMTNCLFARGLAGMTGEMTVRYRHPVAVYSPVVVRGWLIESLWNFHKVAASLIQDDREVASATGKFMTKNQRG